MPALTLSTACVLLHIVGASGLFAALGVEGAGLFCLSRATTNHQVRSALSALGLNRFIGPPSILATLVPGLYMIRTWGWPPWIGASLGLLVIAIVVGAVVTGRRTARLERRIGVEGEFHDPMREPALTASFVARAVLLVAILVLMVTKPELATCLAVAGVAVATGAVLSVRALAARPARPPAKV